MRPSSIHPTAFIASTAAVMGDVTLGEDASVWYGAVLRGDMAPIVIGAQSNIQDGTIVHVDAGVPCSVRKKPRSTPSCANGPSGMNAMRRPSITFRPR